MPSIFFVAFIWIHYLSLILKEALFILRNNFLLQWLVGRFQGCLTDPWSSQEDIPAVELQGQVLSVILLVSVKARDFSNHFTCCFSASQRWCTWSRGRTMLMTRRRRRTQTAWCPPSWRHCRNWTNTFRIPAAMSVCGNSPREHKSSFTSNTVWGSSVLLQVLPGTVLDEVQHLCVPPEVIHQLLERDMLLSAEEHLELYDSPIVLDLDAGERPNTPPPPSPPPPPTPALPGCCSCCCIKNEIDCWSASLNRDGTPQPLRQHHLRSLTEAPKVSSICVTHRMREDLKVLLNSPDFLLSWIIRTSIHPLHCAECFVIGPLDVLCPSSSL